MGLASRLGLLLRHAPGRDIDLAAGDGLDARLFGRVVKVQDAKHDAVVGQRQGRHAHLGGSTGQVLDLAQAVEQREITVDVQVNEIGHWPHPKILF